MADTTTISTTAASTSAPATSDRTKEELQNLELLLGKLMNHGFGGGQTAENLTPADMNTVEPITAPVFNPWYQYLCVELMDPTAIPPAKNKASDAGYDLHSFETYTINPGESILISTKVKIAIPLGYYGRIASRSGMASKANIEVGAGVVDQGYQNEIMVLLRNFGKFPYLVNKGDRVAQIIITPYLSLPVQTVKSIVEIFGASDRGMKGFGSSGK